MRVCFISFEYPPNILGGAGTYAQAIVDGLKHRGVDVFVVTRGDKNDYDEKTFRVPTSNSQYWRRLFFMKSAMSIWPRLNKLGKFDLVHFNEPHIVLERLNLPTICTLHSSQVNEIKTLLAEMKNSNTMVSIRDLILKGPIGSAFDVFTAHTTKKIICPSADLAKQIMSYCFLNEDRVFVIPNGIDLKAFDGTDDSDISILSEYDLEIDNYILYVGRLSAFKGIQYLIAAFRIIKKGHPNLKLVIVGKGEYEKRLKSIVNGMKDVAFTGYVSSLKVKKTLYKNSLFVAVPSLYEAFPMVVLEAMACSKAVIASGVGDIPLLIKHGRNGFLLRPGDSKNLETFMRILLDDENLRKNMGSFGRELVERYFTLDTMVDQTLKVYELIMADLHSNV